MRGRVRQFKLTCLDLKTLYSREAARAFDLRLGRLHAGVGLHLQPADDSIVLALYCCLARRLSWRLFDRHLRLVLKFSASHNRKHHAPDGNTACQFALSQAQASQVVVAGSRGLSTN